MDARRIGELTSGKVVMLAVQRGVQGEEVVEAAKVAARRGDALAGDATGGATVVCVEDGRERMERQRPGQLRDVEGEQGGGAAE